MQNFLGIIEVCTWIGDNVLFPRTHDLVLTAMFLITVHNPSTKVKKCTGLRSITHFSGCTDARASRLLRGRWERKYENQLPLPITLGRSALRSLIKVKYDSKVYSKFKRAQTDRSARGRFFPVPVQQMGVVHEICGESLWLGLIEIRPFHRPALLWHLW